MQRLRLPSGEPAPASFAPARAEPLQSARGASASSSAVASPSPQPVSPTPAVQGYEPVEMSPRTVAPEKRTDLSALRELANYSARSAISRHSQNILINTMHSKLVMALLALAACGGLFWMWMRYGAVESTLYYSLVAMLVAIYFSVQYALLTGRLCIDKSGNLNIDWNTFVNSKLATPSSEQDALQEDQDATEKGTVEGSSAEKLLAEGVGHQQV